MTATQVLKSQAHSTLRRMGKSLVNLADVQLLNCLNMVAHSGPDILHLAIHAQSCTRKPITFMQIGANDGVRDDSFRHLIMRYGMEGILVEPQMRAFQRLQANYPGQTGLAFENVAVAATEGLVRMYAFDEEVDEGTGYQLDVFTSFDRSLLEEARRTYSFKAGITEFDVPTASVSTLLQRHGYEAIDVFVIDVEGYDFEVLKLIDFERHRPSVVQFEHYNLSLPDREACYAFMIDKGYHLTVIQKDTVATLPAEMMLG